MYLVLYIREFEGILGSRSSPLDIQTRVSTCLNLISDGISRVAHHFKG